jgi:phospholipase/lecithinase/hemolysin
MSRFEVDKFLSYVEGGDQEVIDYTADPEAYVAAWEGRAAASRLPLPDAGTFTDEERNALATRDHAELYRIGAHQYVLWHFVEAIRVWTGETTWVEMKERFRADIAGIEDPGVAT